MQIATEDRGGISQPTIVRCVVQWSAPMRTFLLSARKKAALRKGLRWDPRLRPRFMETSAKNAHNVEQAGFGGGAQHLSILR